MENNTATIAAMDDFAVNFVKHANAQEMPSIYEKITAQLNARKDRSAWDRGVTRYALELVEELEELAEYEGRNPRLRERVPGMDVERGEGLGPI